VKVESLRDGGLVSCPTRRRWVDLELCFRCEARRKVREANVVCEVAHGPLYSPERLGMPFLSGRR
jgi:hypothetical protein